MTKQRHFNIPSNISAQLDQMPLTKSTSARRAILGAAARPEVLPMAMRLRQYKDYSDDLTRLAVKDDTDVAEALKDLTSKFRISMEEAVRLATEAYVFKL